MKLSQLAFSDHLSIASLIVALVALYFSTHEVRERRAALRMKVDRYRGEFRRWVIAATEGLAEMEEEVRQAAERFEAVNWEWTLDVPLDLHLELPFSEADLTDMSKKIGSEKAIALNRFIKDWFSYAEPSADGGIRKYEAPSVMKQDIRRAEEQIEILSSLL